MICPIVNVLMILIGFTFSSFPRSSRLPSQAFTWKNYDVGDFYDDDNVYMKMIMKIFTFSPFLRSSASIAAILSATYVFDDNDDDDRDIPDGKDRWFEEHLVRQHESLLPISAARWWRRTKSHLKG